MTQKVTQNDVKTEPMCFNEEILKLQKEMETSKN